MSTTPIPTVFNKTCAKSGADVEPILTAQMCPQTIKNIAYILNNSILLLRVLVTAICLSVRVNDVSWITNLV